ncbi:MarR family winged helix-turn-helix transcriptional regulator [Companilactobacillus zhongbaensis]|uniref:MarR family winged helix-turn-helix transcriptional regulator n=1 Tax=Companilactobacillus zhongbaensis TaxID=2486009 RepID=UPI000F7B8B45|nr:MarR family transcriptional regulator [Companilactobacillus zhongbaensis]
MTNLTDELMKKLHFISKASNQYMHQNKQRLTGQQRVLAILNLEDNLAQSYLQEVLDLRPSSLAELLKKLEDKELIERNEDANDKRIKRITLTEAGKKEAEKNAIPTGNDATEKFFSGLTEEEQENLKANLDKIPEGWDEDFQQNADSFIDPMDRFENMQKVREEIMSKYGDNIDEMSEQDFREMRKEMRSKMQEMGMMMHGRNHGPQMGPGHRMPEGMEPNMHHRNCGGPGMHHRADFRFDGRW